MKCQTMTLPGGGSAFLCGSRSKKPAALPKCSVCGVRVGSLLCDGSGPVKGRRLCSVPLCEHCNRKEGERDLCPRHPVQGSLL